MTAPQKTFYGGRWRDNPATSPAAGLTAAMQHAVIASELGTLVRLGGEWRSPHASLDAMRFKARTIGALIGRDIFRDRGDGSVALTKKGRVLYFHLKRTIIQ